MEPRRPSGARAALLDTLAPACDFQGVMKAALENHDCLDALVCVVAGMDFLEGRLQGLVRMRVQSGTLGPRARVLPLVETSKDNDILTVD